MSAEERENFTREMRVKKNRTWYLGFFLGYQPNAAHLDSSGPRLAEVSSSLLQWEQSLNNPQTLADGTKPDQSASVIRTANSIGSLPVGFKLAFQWDSFLFRLGWGYHFAGQSTNELEYKANVPAALGEAPPYNTNGETLKIINRVSLSYIEVPLTMAVRIVNIRSSSIYLGGGPSWYYGGWKREVLKNDTDSDIHTGNLADIDSFTAAAWGFHIVTGAEVFFGRRISLNCELMYSFGSVSGVEDSVISESGKTVKIDATGDLPVDGDSLRVGASGTESTEAPERADILFGGVQLLIGLNYYL